MRNSELRERIQAAATHKEADVLIETNTGLKTTEEKFAFLCGMFGDKTISKNAPKDKEEVYNILLSTVIRGYTNKNRGTAV